MEDGGGIPPELQRELERDNLQLEAERAAMPVMRLIRLAKASVALRGGARIINWDNRFTTASKEEDPEKQWGEFEKQWDPSIKPDGRNNNIVKANLARYGTLKELGFPPSKDNSAVIDLGHGTRIGVSESWVTIHPAFSNKHRKVFLIKTEHPIAAANETPQVMLTQNIGVARNLDELEKGVRKNIAENLQRELARRTKPAS